MDNIIYLGLGGGLFSLLTLTHFIVDWLFQSHNEAMIKHSDAKIRAKHCTIYTIGFLPLLTFCHFVNALSIGQLFLSLIILFVSHFYLDTYHGVYLWAKYLRRPSEMTDPIKQIGRIDGYVKILPPDPKEGFKLFVQSALGKILLIAVDQIFHLVFLIPIVCFILSNVNIDLPASCNYLK